MPTFNIHMLVLGRIISLSNVNGCFFSPFSSLCCELHRHRDEAEVLLLYHSVAACYNKALRLNSVEEEMESFVEVIHTKCFFVFTVFSRPVSIFCLIIGS